METCRLCDQQYNGARAKRGVCPVCYLRCLATHQIAPERPGLSSVYITDNIVGYGQIYYTLLPVTVRMEVFLCYNQPGLTPTFVAHTCKNGTVLLV